MNPTTTRLGVIYECPTAKPATRRAPMPGLQPVLSTHRHRRSLPYCDEPVAISDLAEPTTPTTPQAVIMTT